MTNKFETTEGVAKKIWNGLKKNSIHFGDVHTSNTSDVITKEWKADPLPNGAIVSFHFSHKKGKNKNGAEHNPRYIIALTHNKTTEKVSGMYARKVYHRLINGSPRKRSNKLTSDKSQFCVDALSDL